MDARKRSSTRQAGPVLLQHPDVTGKAFALLLISACAVVIIFQAPLIPRRGVAPGSKVVNALEPEGGRAYSQLPFGYRAAAPLALGYLVPNGRTGKPAREGRDPAGPLSLATVRDAGLLRGYSLPPDRLAFTPTGKAVFIPGPPAPSAPCEPVAIERGNVRAPRIALTFDTADVPDPGAQPIIDELTRLRVPATFFVCGGWCRARPALLRALVERGFEVANHSDSHPWFTKIPDHRVVAELVATSDAVQKLGGAPVAAYFRPPFEDVDARVKALAAQCGYRVVLWNRDTIDWGPATRPEQIVSRATDFASNGDIILMHTHGRYTASALPEIVNRLRSRGFELTTVSGVLQP